MKRKICVLIVLGLLVSLCFTGCGSKGGENGIVNVYNWGEYIDESVFDAFEKQTGIKVNYKTFETNEQLYSVLKQGGVSYDVIIPSDYMASRLKDEGMLEKLDFSNIPNFANVLDQYKSLEFDPDNEYTVAYMAGTVGIIYNSSVISENITSWSALFDKAYSGQILMFDNSRDAMMIALKYLGYSLNTTDEAELAEAYELLEQQKPLLQGYVMDQIFDKLESGEAAIGPYYAGDFLTMLEGNSDLRFVIPTEGSNSFVDSMCIPKGAANKTNAELFINYMCSKEVSAANMLETGYTSVIDGAAELNNFSDFEMSIFYPSDEVLDTCETYINLPSDSLLLYDEYWVKLKS